MQGKRTAATRRLFLYIVLSWFLLFCASLCLAGNAISKSLVTVSTPYGTFEIRNVSVMPDGAISGTIENNTSRSWEYAQFHIYPKDKKGRILTYRNTTVSCQLVAGAKSLAKGQVGRIQGDPAPSYLAVPGKFTDFDIEFSPDDSHFVLNYVFTMVSPRESPTAAFGDESISVVFSPSNQEIAFRLENRTGNSLTLNWDQMAYVDFDGSSHRVIHQGVRFIQRDAPQSPTVVAPYSSVQDFVYPSDRVSWGSATGQWLQLPIWSSIPSAGQKFSVFMQIVVNGKAKNYLFTIKVAEVRF